MCFLLLRPQGSDSLGFAQYHSAIMNSSNCLLCEEEVTTYCLFQILHYRITDGRHWCDNLYCLLSGNTRRSANDGRMLGQRLRHWPNILPSLVERPVFAVTRRPATKRLIHSGYLCRCPGDGVMSTTTQQERYVDPVQVLRWASIVDDKPTLKRH